MLLDQASRPIGDKISHEITVAIADTLAGHGLNTD
jgi:hypothetical protein